MLARQQQQASRKSFDIHTLSDAIDKLKRENGVLKDRLRSLRGATAATTRLSRAPISARQTHTSRGRTGGISRLSLQPMAQLPEPVTSELQRKIEKVRLDLAEAQVTIKRLKEAAARPPTPPPPPAVPTTRESEVQTDPPIEIPKDISRFVARVALAKPPPESPGGATHCVCGRAAEVGKLRRQVKRLEKQLDSLGGGADDDDEVMPVCNHDHEMRGLRADNERLFAQTITLQQALKAAKSSRDRLKEASAHPGKGRTPHEGGGRDSRGRA